MTLPSRARVVQPTNGVFEDVSNTDASGTHHMENGIRGAFGNINVDGPNTDLRSQKPNVDAHEVSLKFKFVRRDTGAPVIIPWMQFSFFDFDENDNDEPAGDGREARDPPHPTHPPTHPSGNPMVPNRPALTPSPRPGGSVSQCISASGFVEYALSEGSKVTETEAVSNAGGINTGARPSPQASSPHSAPPLHGAFVQQAPPCVRREVLLVAKRRRIRQPGRPTRAHYQSKAKDCLVLL